MYSRFRQAAHVLCRRTGSTSPEHAQRSDAVEYGLLKFFHLGAVLMGGGLIGVWMADLRSRLDAWIARHTARSSAEINSTLGEKIDRRMLSNFRSSAILDALPRCDFIARRAGALPFCLTALRFPQSQIKRLQKSLPHANAGGCFAHYPKPSFHAHAQHGAPNVCRDGYVRDLNDRQGM